MSVPDAGEPLKLQQEKRRFQVPSIHGRQHPVTPNYKPEIADALHDRQAPTVGRGCYLETASALQSPSTRERAFTFLPRTGPAYCAALGATLPPTWRGSLPSVV